jgi:hypothetical protein
MFTNIHLFFTFWVIVLLLFHKNVYRHINLLYLTFLTMIGGLYISYIHPQYYNFTLFNEQYKLKHADKFVIVDMFFHILAFVFICSMYSDYYSGQFNSSLLLAIFIVSLHVILVDSTMLYNVKPFEMLAVFVLANIAYLLLFGKKYVRR